MAVVNHAGFTRVAAVSLLALIAVLQGAQARAFAPLVIVDCLKAQWPADPKCPFRCPDNSCVKQSSTCVKSIDDCECERWFKKTSWGTCERDFARQCLTKLPGRTSDRDGCDYVCPPNSCMREGVTCLQRFEQCECEPGFKPTPYTNRCVPKTFEKNTCRRQQREPKPGCGFVCPEYSCINPGTRCVNGIRDCKCIDGYIMTRLGICQQWGEPTEGI
mmetsp:Transcript_46395/g.116043  ORF Transcript_46395/g.116043 Transcript_46395/m.116043 type:complete len:217 (-) Transcript_46395:223-873(-)|eukprot:jgi/Tetstr1/442094/TSEL_030253.t1